MSREHRLSRVLALLAAAAFGAVLSAQPAKPPQKPQPPTRPQPLSLAALSQEVQALSALSDLDLDGDQLQALAKLASGAAAPVEPEEKPAEKTPDKKKVSDAFQKALKELHAALLKGDEEKIADCRANVDELRDNENPDLDDEFDTTEVAKKRVAQVLRLLTVRQLGGYVSGLDLREPHEMLMEAFEEVHKREGEERDKYIQQTSEEIAQMISGE